MRNDRITKLARTVGRLARRRGVEITAAESCTGGGLAEAITRISGSAKWFDRGFVTYSNDAKKRLLGVKQRTLKQHGAVSEPVAREMARGALRASPSEVSVAITGIAGPTGGSREKPVGLVWFAWAVRGGEVQAREMRFRGDREAIRLQAVVIALEGLAQLLRKRAR